MTVTTPVTKYEFVQGDTKPDLQETLWYSDGRAVDLTGCHVMFHMRGDPLRAGQPTRGPPSSPPTPQPAW